MQTLTGAVLIAAPGIFCLVALLARDPLDCIAGIIALVLGVFGARSFISGLVRQFRQPDEIEELRATYRREMK
jgi:hypothetical protein